MAERLIELREIAKSFGRVYALGGINLHVDKGEVVGLIGDNGAGKSTLIKILAGVVKPTSGEILVRGQPVTGWNAAKSRAAGIETVFRIARSRSSRRSSPTSSWAANSPGLSAGCASARKSRKHGG